MTCTARWFGASRCSISGTRPRASVGPARHAEEVLQARRDERRLSRRVLHVDAAPARQRHPLRRLLAEEPGACGAEPGDERAEEARLAQVGEAVAPRAQLGERRLELRLASVARPASGRFARTKATRPRSRSSASASTNACVPRARAASYSARATASAIDVGELRRPGAPLVEHERVVAHALDHLDALGRRVPLVRRAPRGCDRPRRR